jgi:uncharacterized membrane protein
VRLWWLAAALLLGTGIALLVLAVLERTIGFALVLFVPVFFSSSWELPVGAFLVLSGVFSALFGLSDEGPVELADPAGPSGASAGGVVVIGPVPIFYGSGSRLSRRTRWIVTIVCVAVFVAVLAVLGFIA